MNMDAGDEEEMPAKKMNANTMCYVKVYEVGGEIIVAACDEELLGKEFREGDLILMVNKEFYGDELVPLNVAIAKLRTATIANIVGENIVNAAISEGIIHEDAVIRICNIPHAQLVKMR